MSSEIRSRRKLKIGVEIEIEIGVGVGIGIGIGIGIGDVEIIEEIEEIEEIGIDGKRDSAWNDHDQNVLETATAHPLDRSPRSPRGPWGPVYWRHRVISGFPLRCSGPIGGLLDGRG